MLRDLGKLTSRWSWVHGMRFHVRVPRGHQDPRAPAVVLVHGIGVSSRYMAPLAAELAPHARVYVPDLPGFGHSSKPRRILGIDELADQLALWLEAEQLERPLLVGNSVGCQIVTELAIRHPERVGAVVLQGPTMDAAARSKAAHLRRWMKAGPLEPSSLLLVLLRDYLDCGPRRLWRTFDAALAHPLEERISLNRLPTLVVRGSRDPIASQAWCERLVDLLPNGRLAIIPGPAHTLNYAAPASFRRVLLPFLARWSVLETPLLEPRVAS